MVERTKKSQAVLLAELAIRQQHTEEAVEKNNNFLREVSSKLDQIQKDVSATYTQTKLTNGRTTANEKAIAAIIENNKVLKEENEEAFKSVWNTLAPIRNWKNRMGGSWATILIIVTLFSGIVTLIIGYLSYSK